MPHLLGYTATLTLEVDAPLAGHLLHQLHLHHGIIMDNVMAVRAEHDHIPVFASPLRELAEGKRMVHLELLDGVPFATLLAAALGLAVTAVAQFAHPTGQTQAARLVGVEHIQVGLAEIEMPPEYLKPIYPPSHHSLIP